MELTQIKYFIAVAQNENMSRAAEQLHISQPSLSRAVSKLEEELGCKLLDRVGRRVTLNAEGRRFLTGALAMVRELDDTTYELNEMINGQTTRLTIGITGNNSTLTDTLMEFAQNHPSVRMTIHCNIDAEENLDINRYDMLIYPASERYKKFNGVHLCTSPYLLAVGDTHPLYRKVVKVSSHRPVAISDLINEEFVFVKQGNNYIEEPYELCVGSALHPVVKVFTNSQDMHRQIIASGAAIGFVSQESAEAYAADRRIGLVPIKEAKYATELMVCFKRDKHLCDMGRELKEFVLGQMQEVH